MTKSQWDKYIFDVKDKLAKRVFNFITPISASDSPTGGYLIGTGNYVEFFHKTFLVTNSHVITEAGSNDIAHLPGPSDDYIKCQNYFHRHGRPIDIAITNVNLRKSLLLGNFEEYYSPIEDELLFWVGYPGTTAHRMGPIFPSNKRQSYFGVLNSPAVPFLMRAKSVPEIEVESFFDNQRDVLVEFPLTANSQNINDDKELPNAKGLSGSFLWDTKVEYCRRTSKKWSPDKARICGLIWGQMNEVIIATKIEYVMPVILDFFRSDAAYFNWLARRKPIDDPLTDWYYAMDLITHLK